MNAVIVAIFLFIALLIFAMTVMCFLHYIFESIAIFRMMKQRNMECPALAWIPITHLYSLGSVHDDIKREQGKDPYFRFILLACQLVNIAISVYFIILFICAVANIVKSATLGYAYSSMSEIFASSQLQLLGLIAPIWQIISLGFIVIYLICLNVIFKKYVPKKDSYFIGAIIFTIIPIAPFVPGMLLLKASKNNPAKNQVQYSDPSQ